MIFSTLFLFYVLPLVIYEYEHLLYPHPQPRQTKLKNVMKMKLLFAILFCFYYVPHSPHLKEYQRNIWKWNRCSFILFQHFLTANQCSWLQLEFFLFPGNAGCWKSPFVKKKFQKFVMKWFAILNYFFEFSIERQHILSNAIKLFTPLIMQCIC